MLGMLDEGTDKYNSAEIAEAKENLGATISASPSMDRSSVYLSALTANLPPSLDLMADIVRHPAFAPAEVNRVRDQQLASLPKKPSSRSASRFEHCRRSCTAKRHPYGVPFSGSGDPAAVAKLTPADLTAFHDHGCGPTTRRSSSSATRRSPRSCRCSRRASAIGVRRARAGQEFRGADGCHRRARILLLDRPNTPQSLIFAGELLPVQGTDDLVALMQANDVLGRLLPVAAQHRPARDQALVLWRPGLHQPAAAPGSVPDLCAGPDRPDGAVDRARCAATSGASSAARASLRKS